MTTTWQQAAWDESIRRQTISLNPGAALQDAIEADDFWPVESEFEMTGRIFQAGEHPQTGERRLYYAVIPNWADVRWFGEPAGGLKTGVFVSRYQGRMNWSKAKAAGIQYAMIKITEGDDWTDPQGMTNYNGTAAAGLPRGLLHYYKNNLDPIEQAEWFFKHYRPCEIGPIVDCEDNTTPAGNLADNIHAYLLHISIKTGRTPIVYTGKPWWDRNIGRQSWASLYPLYIAAYPNPNDGTPPDMDKYKVQLPLGWTDWTFWQWACGADGEEYGAGPGAVEHICLEYWKV